MTLHTETRAYRVETERNALFVTVTRKEDGATCFLQESDAADCVDALDRIWDGVTLGDTDEASRRCDDILSALEYRNGQF